MINYSQNFRKQSKFLLVLLLQTTFSTFKRRNDKTASPCRRQGRQKRSQRHTKKTAAFNQLPAADQEAESLQKILQATAVGPGSYKKGASAHRSMPKRIIRNDEMENYGNRINNAKCNHDQCKNQNGVKIKKHYQQILICC